MNDLRVVQAMAGIRVIVERLAGSAHHHELTERIIATLDRASRAVNERPEWAARIRANWKRSEDRDERSAP